MSSTKNPIDRFVYGIRDGFKNVGKAFAESEVIYKCIKVFLPANKYSKNIYSYANQIIKLLNTEDIVCADREFNRFYRMLNIESVEPDDRNFAIMHGYIRYLIRFSFFIKEVEITDEQFDKKAQELLRKTDRELSKKDREVLKNVLTKMEKLKDSIKIK